MAIIPLCWHKKHRLMAEMLLSRSWQVPRTLDTAYYTGRGMLPPQRSLGVGSGDVPSTGYMQKMENKLFPKPQGGDQDAAAQCNRASTSNIQRKYFEHTWGSVGTSTWIYLVTLWWMSTSSTIYSLPRFHITGWEPPQQLFGRAWKSKNRRIYIRNKLTPHTLYARNR